MSTTIWCERARERANERALPSLQPRFPVVSYRYRGHTCASRLCSSHFASTTAVSFVSVPRDKRCRRYSLCNGGKEKFIGPSFLFPALLAQLPLHLLLFYSSDFRVRGRFVSFRFVSFRCSTWFRRPCPYIGSLNLVDFDTAAATLPRLIPPRERNQDGSFVLLLSSLLSFSSVSFLSDFALEIDGRPLPILENRSPRPCKRETRRLLARVSTLNFCEFSVALVETLFVNARVCVNVVLSRSLLTEQIFFLSFFFPFVSRTQATPALEKISSGEIAGERLTYEALYY